MKSARDNTAVYWMGTLLFAGATFSAFLVLFLLILTDQPSLILIEVTDTILCFTLLVITLLFAIALAYAERKVRLLMIESQKEAQKA